MHHYGDKYPCGAEGSFQLSKLQRIVGNLFQGFFPELISDFQLRRPYKNIFSWFSGGPEMTRNYRTVIVFNVMVFRVFPLGFLGRSHFSSVRFARRLPFHSLELSLKYFSAKHFPQKDSQLSKPPIVNENPFPKTVEIAEIAKMSCSFINMART